MGHGMAKSPRHSDLQFKGLLTPYSQKYLKYISSGNISRKAVSASFQLKGGVRSAQRILAQLHRLKKNEAREQPRAMLDIVFMCFHQFKKEKY